MMTDLLYNNRRRIKKLGLKKKKGWNKNGRRGSKRKKKKNLKGKRLMCV